MTLSVVICLYNTPAEYLSACIRSILDEHIPDSEILVVDDGSSTDYSVLLEDFGVRFFRTENRGTHAARLLGIREARGEYVAFVDSDDLVSCRYHLPMLRAARERRADVVFNDWAFLTLRSPYYCTKDDTIAKDIDISKPDALSFFLSQEGRQHSYFVAWNKLYRRDLLNVAVQDIRRCGAGETRLTFAEDVLMNFFVFLHAKHVVNVHTGYYFYRIHDAQSVRVTGESRLLSQMEHMAFVFSVLHGQIAALPDAGTYEPHLRAWELLMARSFYSHLTQKKFYDLKPQVCRLFHTDELRRTTRRDGAVYAKNRLLGENFFDIDAKLAALYEKAATGKTVTVRTGATDPYTRARLAEIYAVSEGRVHPVRSKTADVVIPKQKIRLKNRLLHNYFIYSLGMILFKKGSKLRAFLKRHL